MDAMGIVFTECPYFFVPDWGFQLDPSLPPAQVTEKMELWKWRAAELVNSKVKKNINSIGNPSPDPKNPGESHVCLKHGYWRSLRSSLSRWNRRKTTEKELKKRMWRYSIHWGVLKVYRGPFINISLLVGGGSGIPPKYTYIFNTKSDLIVFI